MPFRPPSARRPASAPAAPRAPRRATAPHQPGPRAASATPFPRVALLFFACAIVLGAALAGCAGRGDGFTPPADEAERATRIARLEARLATDRAALADLVAAQRDAGQPPLDADPALRALADRVVADSATLDRLQRGADAEETGR